MSTKSKRVLIVVDCHNWAFGHVGHGIKKYAPEEYKVDVLDSSEFGKKFPKSQCRGYDAVCQMSWSESNTAVDCKRSVAVVAHFGAFYTQSTQDPVGKMLVSGNRNIENAARVLPKFDELICFNESLAGLCRKKFKKGVCVHPGFDPEFFYFEPQECSHAVTVAQESKVKGLNIARQIQGLEVVTSNPHQNPMGHKSLGELYRQYSEYVCTSYSEGGPMTVIEALACGLIVHSTRVGVVADFEDTLEDLHVYSSPEDLLQRYRVKEDIDDWEEGDMSEGEFVTSESNAVWAKENLSWEIQSKKWLEAICG